EEERSHLANYEKIFTSVQDAYNALYGENKGLDWLNIAQQSLQEIQTYDENIAENAEELTNYYYNIEELSYKLRNFIDMLEYNPTRLNEVESRLNEINRLKKKYGTTVNEINLLDDNSGITLHRNGFDHIRFMISTNPGEPLKELNKVASGGEISRLMLILKKIFSSHQGITSVIFDEVDTGVSGRVAQAIGEKIYQISKESQVLCITHLPQAAAMADTHALIKKEEEDNRTTTSVFELSYVDKVEELSRMVTGTKLTETAKEHASELLDLAAKYKNKT